MDSSLRERFERLARTQALEPVRSGSPAVLVLRPAPGGTDIAAIPAVTALVRRGVGLLPAKRAVESCRDTGHAILEVPTVEDRSALSDELSACAIAAGFVESSTIDVKAVRRRLGLTQQQFALRYGLDLNSLQNWETGRRQPDAAVSSYLKVIDRLPDAVSEALEDGVSPADELTIR